MLKELELRWAHYSVCHFFLWGRSHSRHRARGWEARQMAAAKKQLEASGPGIELPGKAGLGRPRYQREEKTKETNSTLSIGSPWGLCQFKYRGWDTKQKSADGFWQSRGAGEAKSGVQDLARRRALGSLQPHNWKPLAAPSLDWEWTRGGR